MTSSATPTVIPAEGYAGDVTPQQAWQWVQEGKAVLVDVRSSAEMEWVGRVPGAAAVPWKQWPGMAMNPDFDAQLRAAVPQLNLGDQINPILHDSTLHLMAHSCGHNGECQFYRPQLVSALALR